METEIARTEVVHSGSDLIRTYAELRVACQLSRAFASAHRRLVSLAIGPCYPVGLQFGLQERAAMNP